MNIIYATFFMSNCDSFQPIFFTLSQQIKQFIIEVYQNFAVMALHAE